MKNAKIVQLLAMVVASSTLGAKGLSCIGSCTNFDEHRIIPILPAASGEDGGPTPSEAKEDLCAQHCHHADSCKETTIQEADGTSINALECEWHHVCGAGRRPAGYVAENGHNLEFAAEWLGQSALLEAISVDAFRLLRRDLRALRAPRALLRQASRAMREEKRHARRMRALAKRAGRALPIPKGTNAPIPTLEELAQQNAVEGCIREMFGAIVARYQAEHAADREVATTMRRIAEEEAYHGALAYRIDAWAQRRLGHAARARIAESRRLAIDELLQSAARSANSRSQLALGLPDACTTSILVRNLFAVLSDKHRCKDRP